MSRDRRDIETVIQFLNAFTKKLEDRKITNVLKLLSKIKEDQKKESVTKYLKKYIDSKNWTQHYLVVSLLKMQVILNELLL